MVNLEFAQRHPGKPFGKLPILRAKQIVAVGVVALVAQPKVEQKQLQKGQRRVQNLDEYVAEEYDGVVDGAQSALEATSEEASMLIVLSESQARVDVRRDIFDGLVVVHGRRVLAKLRYVIVDGESGLCVDSTP
jgi:hypothetical protein